ncbi:Microbial collagenase, secreted [Enhygromyxa salina]|uniref:Microbial collagenase, secreted n=1 Tax=Enhygromyxa salina TaxID=215803 RepID=A0A0C2A231_9BACT|nr:DUF4215 domain-containing protein [Enhygromyxa salina]KIG17463.1 Microbial collagenase, secreted [Enhygromyxa salina]
MRPQLLPLGLSALVGLSVAVSCTPAPSNDDGFTSFTTLPPGDGDGDSTETGDGDGDPGDGDGDSSCGDMVVDPGEECDLGPQNSAMGQCTPDCKIAACGDGYLYENFEECDDGNSSNADDCVTGCKIATCGDGFVHDGVEICDDGNDDNADGCTTECVEGSCGDGILQAGEQCDDGNDVTSDECPACQLAFCGDGYVQAGVEECDDGNDLSNDACLATFCTPNVCGDGFIYEGMETCDDANLDDDDACPSSCEPAFCGDGFTWAGMEECDDGNDVEDDICTSECISNGIFWMGSFNQGVDGQMACASWNTFRTDLQAFNNFTRVAIWGSNDPMGVECNGAAANTICQALASGQAMTNIACDGRTWNVGTCGSGIELNAQGNGVCQCTNPGYIARPCIGGGNPNWGGVNTATCSGPTQTIEVVCQ